MINSQFCMGPRLAVTCNTAAALMDVSPSVFRRWVKKGLMPQAINMDGRQMWLVPALIFAFLKNDERNQRFLPSTISEEAFIQQVSAYMAPAFLNSGKQPNNGMEISNDGENPFDHTVG